MEDAVRQRIMTIFSEKGVSINSLSNGNSALQRKMNRQINEGAAITIETISSILYAFPDISAEWLFRGEGKMLKVESFLLASASNPYKELYDESQIEIRKLNREIGALESEIEMLKNKIPDKDWKDKIKPTGTE